MGGFGALSLALRHPDLYAAAASHSGVVALLFNGPVPYAEGQGRAARRRRRAGAARCRSAAGSAASSAADIANWRAHDPATLVTQLPANAPHLYLDCGTEDDFMLNNQAAYVHDLLARPASWSTNTSCGPGHHDFGFWGVRLPNSLVFLRKYTTPARDTE